MTSMNPFIQLKTTPQILITLSSPLLRAFAESASGQPTTPGAYPNFTTAAGESAS